MICSADKRQPATMVYSPWSTFGPAAATAGIAMGTTAAATTGEAAAAAAVAAAVAAVAASATSPVAAAEVVAAAEAASAVAAVAAAAAAAAAAECPRARAFVHRGSLASSASAVVSATLLASVEAAQQHKQYCIGDQQDHHLMLHRKRHPAAPIRIELALNVDHYIWLWTMGREHYYGYAGAHKALRDVLLWAAEATPEDTHWMFTAGLFELESWSRMNGTSGSTRVTASADAADATARAIASTLPSVNSPPSGDLSKVCNACLCGAVRGSNGYSFVSGHSEAASAGMPCPTSPNWSIMSAMSVMSSTPTPASSVDGCGQIQDCDDELSSMCGSEGDVIISGANADDQVQVHAPFCVPLSQRASGPIAVDARLPAHVVEWLALCAHDYTKGDLSLAVDVVCTIAIALGTPEDIFNAGDEGLAYASSADLYAMIGISDPLRR